MFVVQFGSLVICQNGPLRSPIYLNDIGKAAEVLFRVFAG